VIERPTKIISPWWKPGRMAICYKTPQDIHEQQHEPTTTIWGKPQQLSLETSLALADLFMVTLGMRERKVAFTKDIS
jgi:hypothetical protein